MLEVMASNLESFVCKNDNFQEDRLVTIEAIREYLALLWGQYQELKLREEKSLVLDEICRNLRIHRKSALRLMNGEDVPRKKRGPSKTQRKRYSVKTKEEVKKYWRKTGYIGSPRLKSAIIDWLPHDIDLKTDAATQAELLRVSASTIERWLKPEKAALRRRLNGGTRSPKKIVTTVPIRNLEFVPKTAGYCEVDSVHHCGGSLSGNYARTLTMVDLAFGWTECEALEALNGVVVKNSLEEIEKRLPFSMVGFYADGGVEFWNKDVIERFINRDGREIPMEYGRGRPYKKNDQAHVEQKNYTHVRQYFGYDRISGRVAVNKMNAIYRKEWRLLQNYFLPQSKLISKERIGSKVIRKMDAPKTPYQRMLESETVSDKVKEQLLKEREALNPFELRQKLTKKLRDLRRWLKDEWTNPYYGKYHDKV